MDTQIVTQTNGERGKIDRQTTRQTKKWANKGKGRRMDERQTVIQTNYQICITCMHAHTHACTCTHAHTYTHTHHTQTHAPLTTRSIDGVPQFSKLPICEFVLVPHGLLLSGQHTLRPLQRMPYLRLHGLWTLTRNIVCYDLLLSFVLEGARERGREGGRE